MAEDWRSEAFRRKVIAQIDEAVRMAATPMTKSSVEMENHVFLKAKTREEYLALVARLILHVKGINAQKEKEKKGMGAGGMMYSQQQGMPQGGATGLQQQPMQDPINALQNLAMQGTTVPGQQTVTNSYGAAVCLKKEDINLDMSRETAVNKSKMAVISALRNVHFATINNLPDDVIPELHQLCIIQGCTQLHNFNLENQTSCIQDLRQALAQVLEDRLVSKIKESGVFSLILDESSDTSVHQKLMVYIRFLESVCGRREPQTRFLGIRQLLVADARSITREILNLLESKGINVEGLVGVATDGDSVKTGCRSGVVTSLREVQPGLLATNCIAHKLALSCNNAVDKVRYLLKFQQVLNSLYNYFENSSRNMARLEEIQAVVEDNKDTGMDEFHTRWLSVDNSVQAVIENYGSIVSVLLEEKNARALSLQKSITCYKFLYVCHFLLDVLPDLARLCKTFQLSQIDFTEVNPFLQSTVQVVEKLLESSSGENLSKFRNQVPSSPQVDCSGSVTFEFKGHTIRDGVNQRAEAESACRQFAGFLVEGLRNRFTDKEDAVVLSALTRLFDPSLVGGHSEVLSDSVDIVVKYLGTVLGLGSVSGVRQELYSFLELAKVQVVGNRKVYSRVQDVVQLAVKHRDSFPVVSKAAERLLLVPVTTVDCEQNFNCQNHIKTDPRNRLSVQSLENLMRILIDHKYSSNNKDFDFDIAFDHWSANSSRNNLKRKFVPSEGQ